MANRICLEIEPEYRYMGRDKMKGQIICPLCNGRRTVGEGDIEIPCYECGGTGWVDEGKIGEQIKSGEG